MRDAEQPHSRPQSPSFLGHVVGQLQIKPSGSGDENGTTCTLTDHAQRPITAVTFNRYHHIIVVLIPRLIKSLVKVSTL